MASRPANDNDARAAARLRREQWFWRGLTGLVFAGTIAMLFV